MPLIWGIHNDQTALDLVREGFVSVGWEDLGDIRQLVGDRDALKIKIAATYPTAKPGAIPICPIWAGILVRFIGEINIGDYIISPNKADRTLNFGVVNGDAYFDADASVHPNRRPVRWIRTGVPRDTFSKSALHEIGSAVTLFRVARHAEEFLHFLQTSDLAAPALSTPAVDVDADVELVEDEPNAERVDTYSRDFVVDILKRMDAFRFEHFIAGLLTAIGWRAQGDHSRGRRGFRRSRKPRPAPARTSHHQSPVQENDLHDRRARRAETSRRPSPWRIGARPLCHSRQLLVRRSVSRSNSARPPSLERDTAR